MHLCDYTLGTIEVIAAALGLSPLLVAEAFLRAPVDGREVQPDRRSDVTDLPDRHGALTG